MEIIKVWFNLDFSYLDIYVGKEIVVVVVGMFEVCKVMCEIKLIKFVIIEMSESWLINCGFVKCICDE